MTGRYLNKTVIVTGGAGHLGQAITRAYLRDGADVVICGRRAPAQPIAENGRQAVFVQADIREAEQSQHVVDEAMGLFGRLDLLVNNAGGSPPMVAAEVSPMLTEKILKLNLLAPLVMSQQAYQAMTVRRVLQAPALLGNIINIASVSGARPSPGTAAYGAAKAGLLNATKSLAMEWGPWVRVNALIIGLVRHDAGLDHYGGEAGFNRVANMLPLKRMAEPEDVANACQYLSSEQASYISGATLEVDGGGEVPVFLYLAEQS